MNQEFSTYIQVIVWILVSTIIPLIYNVKKDLCKRTDEIRQDVKEIKEHIYKSNRR